MIRFPMLTTLKSFAAATLLLAGAAQAAHNPDEPSLTRSADAVCLLSEKGVLQLNKQNCRIYINGFLDGAVLTDSVIINRVRDRSEFFERAYATRVGAANGPLPATYFADFCIAPDISRQQIVDTVMKRLEQNKHPGKDERTAVYSAIKSSYPCDEKSY